MGHQREDDLATEFRNPVTHWTGGQWRDGKAYIRGVVDKSAPDLKRWLRSGRVTAPSIFTRPVVSGNDVVDFEDVLSIDWAPLDRQGMQTARVVAWGEIADGEQPTVDDAWLADMRAALGLAADAALADILAAVRKLAGEGLAERVASVAAEMGVPPSARALVARLLEGRLAPTASREHVAGEIAALQRQPDVRAALSGGMVWTPAPVPHGRASDAATSTLSRSFRIEPPPAA